MMPEDVLRENPLLSLGTLDLVGRNNIALIHMDNLRHNMNYLSARFKRISVVVKSDAYGHGIENVVPFVDDLAHSYSVTDNQEAAKLRKLSSKPIMRIRAALFDEVYSAMALDLGISELVGSVEQAQKLNCLAKELGAYLDVRIALNDTGMGREGFDGEVTGDFIAQGVKNLSNLNVQGVFAHLPNHQMVNDDNVRSKAVNIINQIIVKTNDLGSGCIDFRCAA